MSAHQSRPCYASALTSITLCPRACCWAAQLRQGLRARGQHGAVRGCALPHRPLLLRGSVPGTPAPSPHPFPSPSLPPLVLAAILIPGIALCPFPFRLAHLLPPTRQWLLCFLLPSPSFHTCPNPHAVPPSPTHRLSYPHTSSQRVVAHPARRAGGLSSYAGAWALSSCNPAV